MSSNTVKSVDDLIRKVKKDIAKKLNEERSQTLTDKDSPYI